MYEFPKNEFTLRYAPYEYIKHVLMSDLSDVENAKIYMKILNVNPFPRFDSIYEILNSEELVLLLNNLKNFPILDEYDLSPFEATRALVRTFVEDFTDDHMEHCHESAKSVCKSILAINNWSNSRFKKLLSTHSARKEMRVDICMKFEI